MSRLFRKKRPVKIRKKSNSFSQTELSRLRWAAQPEEWTEWSRHYDNLTWGVIAIFSAAVAALLAYCYSDVTTVNQSRGSLPEFTGIILSLVGLFFVATFRRFRRRIHNNLPAGEVQEFLLGPIGEKKIYMVFNQWNVFVFTFIMADCFFILKIASRTSQLLLAVIIAIVLLVFGFLWWIGLSEREEKRILRLARRVLELIRKHKENLEKNLS